MGLISKTTKVKWNARNKKRYVNKGYSFTRIGEEFEVSIEDLTNSNKSLVDVQCDKCGIIIKNSSWESYKKYMKDDGKYYCNKCATKLFAREKMKKTKLKKSKSFEQWCIEHNRQDILNRWDYELNDCKPSEISYGTIKKYWFKCLRGLHESELKWLNSLTRKNDSEFNCSKCNSFAQWGIDNIDTNFLEKYWDWNKNNELNINPWKIDNSSSKIKIFIKCQQKNYHGSYYISCLSFVGNKRCPYCNCNSGKIHQLDSLGALYPQVLGIWSDKNEKSSYEYAPHSQKKVWWKCENNKHKDYFRGIGHSNNQDFRCPSCSFYRGEKRIIEYLINNKINYVQQKCFKELIGLGNGKLSYDFYLSKYNLLIEYQGEQHKKPIDFSGEGKEKAEQKFQKQQEHDFIKCEYAKEHNIKLLEIWYWDFDNIEKILDNVLKLNKID